jgi:alkylation response protein AidB-like acyl-CoA dehydrogenase
MFDLTPAQREAREAIKSFADRAILPYADSFDRNESLPASLVSELGGRGYLGALLPVESGGSNMDPISYGLLNEEIGRACSSARSLLTVHNMVSHAVFRWGNKSMKDRFIPGIATGDTVAAFGLTEPGVGSDARNVETTACASGNGYVLNGRKKWISFGQIAGLFLIFAQCEGKPSAFLVERDRPGLSVIPISGLLGVRASMTAELRLDECRVPGENLVGKVGFGFSHVANSALDFGRYSVAWGCVGIAQACLDASVAYTSERKQFGSKLSEFQLIRQMITNMMAGTRAARLLCLNAGRLRSKRGPEAVFETSIAKYFASITATKCASDAVQIHGANGCGGEYPVQRYYRDAKIMEIIEGSTQLQQVTIAAYGYQQHGM